MQFAKLTKRLCEALPWECRFLIEHVVPWSANGVYAINQVLGVKGILVDAADLKLVSKPRICWTNVTVAAKLVRSGNPKCPLQAKIQGIKPIMPTEIKVGSIEGVKYKLHVEVLRGRALLPCPTRQADERGWTLPSSTDWNDKEALKRHAEDGRKFAPWHYKERAMMVPVIEGEKLRTLSTNVKEQVQFFPRGYLDSPVLKEVLDPEKVKADWMANSWHLGVAEFLLKLVLEGSLSNQIKTVGAKERSCSPRWISPWGDPSWTRSDCWSQLLACSMKPYLED